MDDQRVGAALRAVRIRRGLRQADVAKRAGVGRSVVSSVERGHLDEVSLRGLRRITEALEVRISFTLRMTHGELDRLVNAGHAAMHESLAKYLTALPGWVHAPEVSFAVYGERGVIDILAFHAPTGSLLVIELKTELVSLEDLPSTMDVRVRHAAAIARERGWHARSVSAWVVIADSDMNRRRVSAHRTTLRTVFPADGRRMRAWLRTPSGPMRALSFWANSDGSTSNAIAASRSRVRKRGVERQPGVRPAVSDIGQHQAQRTSLRMLRSELAQLAAALRS